MNIKELNLFYINGDSKPLIVKSSNENIDFFFFYKQIIFKVKQLFNTQTAKYKNHLFTGKSQIGEALCLGQRYTRFEFLLPEVLACVKVQSKKNNFRIIYF